MRPWKRLLHLVRRRRFEADLAEELRLHRQLAEDAARRAGAAPEEARRESARAFGSVALTLEDSRAVWRFAWLDSLAQDIRYALRGFRKSPGFAFAVIGTLALGLGVLATSFSVFNALVLRPFAVRDPYSLYTFAGWGQTKERPSHSPSTWREFTEFRRQNVAFSEVLGYQSRIASMAGKDASVLAVTGNYFNMLGGGICMGRPILESDDGPGDGVAVASYAAWKRRLGADPGAVGTKLYLRGRPVELVGVACPEFNGLEESRVDFWVSLALSGTLLGDADLFGPEEPPRLTVVGRLKAGVTPEGAEATLLAYGRQVSPTWRIRLTYAATGAVVSVPENAKPPQSATLRQSATVLPLDRDSIGGFMPMFAAFGLILLIACANVANMMLARGLARQREIGIRISLGAGRGRMIRQLLTESLLLALPAALAAFGVAHGTIRAALWLQLNVLHADWRWSAGLWNGAPDLRVLAFLLATAGIATLGFGLMPAIQASRSRLVEANRGEFATDYRPARLRNALVVAQVTVCALLLISAGVALRSERRIASQNFGVDARGVFTVTMNRSSTADKKFRQPAMELLLSLSRTASLGVCSIPPGSASPWAKVVSGNGTIDVPLSLVSPEYFGIYGIAVRGRNFSTQEADAGAPVVIVSETAARRLWPHGDALGRTLNLKGSWVFQSGRTIHSAIVIGIARDSIYSLFDPNGANGPTRALLYFPTGLKTKDYASLVVRMKGNPESARRTIEQAVEEVAPNEGTVSSTKERLDRYFYPFRALAAIAGFLGALALLLTVSGVFGVSSYAMTQRRKEFGIRIALGAGEARVMGLALRQSLRLAAAGAAMGVLAALAVARVIAHSLMQTIDVFDLGGYAAGVLVVIAAALAAAWVPARRAVRVDPIVTLRCD